MRFHVLVFSSLLALEGAAPGSAQAQAQGPPVEQSPRAAVRLADPAGVTLTATRISQAMTVDGRLDEEVYRTVEPFSRFIQQEPDAGQPVSEPTFAWIMFDDQRLYVSMRCVDSEPDRIVATEMRRDNNNVFQNDSVTVIFDTFHDRRNGFSFQTNALGALRDSATVDETGNDSWNTLWDVRSVRSNEGYTVEMAIPFKSLRYAGAGPQVWGINIRRTIRRLNESAFVLEMPRQYTSNAMSRLGSAATLVGLETPQQSMNLEVKPYLASSLTTDRTAATPISNKRDASTGFDFKYGLTRGLVADVTVNTDFAQVEEDQQQVNLTRFSLFFPEKRDFFLEGQGMFAFGGVSFGNNPNPGDVPVIFFSRRIGLSAGQSVPVVAGGRVTGRVGRYSIGAVNIQTGDKPSADAVSTNFSAVRLKRDILRRSNIGIVATRRSVALKGMGDNLAFGADANLFLFQNVTANGYYARTDSPGAGDGQDSYRGRIEYAGDRYAGTAEHLLIGSAFNPEVGYVRRTDFRRSFVSAGFSPRPANDDLVRKYHFTGSIDYMTTADRSVLQERELKGRFQADFQNGDNAHIEYARNLERLPGDFTIDRGTVVPAGSYSFQGVTAQYSLGTQRRVSGQLTVSRGSLYDGTKTEARYSGRIGLVPQFAVEPTISLNWVRLPYGDFSAPVVSSRLILTPTPRMALTSFIQYNGGADALSTSLRLRWEYRGGSELFVVYSDGRDTTAAGYPNLLNRSFVVKVTRLVRF
jgi:hypothetical protein